MCVEENPCVAVDKLAVSRGFFKLVNMKPWALVAPPLMIFAYLLGVSASAAEQATLAGRIVSVYGKVMIRRDAGGVSRNLRPAIPGKEIYVGEVITTPSDGKIKLLLEDRSLMDIGPSSLFRLDQMKLEGGAARQVDATIAYGTLRTGVTQKLEGKSHFKVRTSSATMGVRGTEFVVKSEINDPKRVQELAQTPSGQLPGLVHSDPSPHDSKTEVTVLQGRVEVATTAAPQHSRSPAGSPGGTGEFQGTVLLPGMQLVTGTSSALFPAGPARLPSSLTPEIRTLDVQKLAEVANKSRLADTTFDQTAKIAGMAKDEEKQGDRGNSESSHNGEFVKAVSTGLQSSQSGLENIKGEYIRQISGPGSNSSLDDKSTYSLRINLKPPANPTPSGSPPPQ